MQGRVTAISPSWHEWQLVGIRVGVSELKSDWSVGIKVGKDVRVGTRVERAGKRVTPVDVSERVERVRERVARVGKRVNVLGKRACWCVGGRVRSMVGSNVGLLELYRVALFGTNVGKDVGKYVQVPPLSSDMRMLDPQSAQSVPRLQSD